ncbi:hypothetical protein HYALB_00009854 [Hymenoscyphus albidus]|uniref:Uncharacterized protein n=1 Tax=Hymenoscyphus albidus TaxID=595503 RepID=A0A9N9Q2V8_9HELO|nr:hypothetical protein HYALB_00009854 [Hymenoscyphus albidus]
MKITAFLFAIFISFGIVPMAVAIEEFRYDPPPEDVAAYQALDTGILALRDDDSTVEEKLTPDPELRDIPTDEDKAVYWPKDSSSLSSRGEFALEPRVFIDRPAWFLDGCLGCIAAEVFRQIGIIWFYNQTPHNGRAHLEGFAL